MSIDPYLWAKNIRDDLRALSDTAHQTDSFSGRLKNADSHPGEMIATIWNDDRLESFVANLPEGDFQKSGVMLVAAINRLVEAADFDSPWQLIVSRPEWQEVVQAATNMLQLAAVDALKGGGGD